MYPRPSPIELYPALLVEPRVLCLYFSFSVHPDQSSTSSPCFRCPLSAASGKQSSLPTLCSTRTFVSGSKGLSVGGSSLRPGVQPSRHVETHIVRYVI